MGKREKTGNREIMGIVKSIVKRIDEDPATWIKEEEYQKKYGTLTEEDLRKVFSI